MSNSSKLRRYRFTRSGPNTFFADVAGVQDVGVGTPVTPNTDVDAPNTVLIGTGASSQSSAIVGLATSQNGPGQRTNVQFSGPLSQPVELWDLMTGQTGGLTPGAKYYLTNNPKRIGINPGSADFPVQVGIAVSPDTLVIQIDPATDAEFCPDGVTVNWNPEINGSPVRVIVDWDIDNCTLDITQVTNLGLRPTVQQLVDALASAGWTYSPAGDILDNRLASDNEGSQDINCMASELSITWSTMSIHYIDETPQLLPGAATTAC